MNWLRKLAARATPPSALSLDQFVFVRMPAAIDPEQRHSLFEQPIDAELRIAGLGEVSGGGTGLSAPDDDGDRAIEFCGVDVDTHDVASTRALLRSHLPLLDCPVGTTIEYDDGGSARHDRFDGDDWQLAVPMREFE